MFGRVAPGHTATATVQVHPPSDAVVTAAIAQDAAGIFTVRQIVACDVVPEAVDPRDPRARRTRRWSACPVAAAPRMGRGRSPSGPARWWPWRSRRRRWPAARSSSTVCRRFRAPAGRPPPGRSVWPSRERRMSDRRDIPGHTSTGPATCSALSSMAWSRSSRASMAKNSSAAAATYIMSPGNHMMRPPRRWSSMTEVPNMRGWMA